MVVFAPDAYAELCQRVAALGALDHIVHVFWQKYRRDLVRSAQGNVTWMELQWQVRVVAIVSGDRFEYETKGELVGWPEKNFRQLKEFLTQVGELCVLFDPAESGVEHATVEYRDGQFHVQPRDA